MRALRSWFLLVVLLIPAYARASDHNAEFFLAPSFAVLKGSTTKLGGWHVSGAATLKTLKNLSFVGDVSTHFIGSEDRDLTQITLMAGPRWTFARGGDKEYMCFAHFMGMGAVLRSEGRTGINTSAGAVAFGGGCEDVRPKERQWSIRVQIDAIRPYKSSTLDKWTFRMSAGWVYRFHDPHSPSDKRPGGDKKPSGT